MYISQTDIQSKISADLLARIIGADTEAIPTAVMFAEQTITNKLADRYKIANELALTDDARNGVIVEYALNLAVFRLYERIHDNEVPERVVKLYDDTQSQLDKLNTGKTSLSGLDKATDADGNAKSRFNWGSATKRDQSPY